MVTCSGVASILVYILIFSLLQLLKTIDEQQEKTSLSVCGAQQQLLCAPRRRLDHGDTHRGNSADMLIQFDLAINPVVTASALYCLPK